MFEQLLERTTPFVLIGPGAAVRDASGDHEVARKDVALWMKSHREALRTFVIAMVLVEPQTANRFVARAQATIYEKFWGYPMLVTTSEREAVAVAHRLLAGDRITDVLVDEPHVPENG